jgi:hypothetical protein
MSVRLKKLDERIRRSKRLGKIALGGVFLMSLTFGGILVQGLILALETGQDDMVFRAIRSLCCLALLNLVSIALIWRQHRAFHEARTELQELVEGTVE